MRSYCVPRPAAALQRGRSCPGRNPFSSRIGGFPVDSAIAGRKLLFPGERVGDDSIEIVEMWFPVERRAGAVRGGDDLRRIAEPAWTKLDLEIDAGDALDGVDHLEHREAPPVAAIECGRGAAAAQVGERI